MVDSTIVPVKWDGKMVAEVHVPPSRVGPSINVLPSSVRETLLSDINTQGPFSEYMKACVLKSYAQIELNECPPAEPLRKDNLPMVFGWRLAQELERRGRLLPGDIMFNQNNTLSYWYGDKWQPLDIHGTVI